MESFNKGSKVFISHILRIQEELVELAARYRQLSGFGVIQLQSRVQLTAGLIEIQATSLQTYIQNKHIQ